MSQTKKEALGKYIAGKERLQQLLNERDELLEGLDSFTWIQGLSSTAFVVRLDAAGLEGLVRTLANLSVNIDDIVDELNDHAEKCGELKIGVKLAERLPPGGLKLTKPRSELGVLRE